MRPVKLILENVGPFPGRTSVDFTALDDVFLISGKTGSGKTTILDAICFALYGSLPGSRKGYAGRIKSDYAEKYDECSVTLDFSLGKKTYRIERSPRQEKPKKRGNGFSQSEESAVLYELRDGKYISISSRKTEADSKIVELIGLSEDEFSKIVLLPQGEFAEFLKQNSNDRRKVLQKLFPVEKAVAIREYVQEQAKIIEARKRETEQTLQELSRRLSPETYGESLEKAKEEADAAREMIRRIQEQNSILARAFDIEKSLLEYRERIEAAVQEALLLDKQENGIRNQEAMLAKSREAQPLMRYILLYNENTGILRKNETELDQFLLKEKEAAKNLEYFKDNGDFEKNHEDELLLLRGKRIPLAELVKDEQTLNANQEELHALRLKQSSVMEARKRIELELAGMDKELQELESIAGDSGKYEAEWDKRRLIKEWLVNAKKTAEQGQSSAAEIESIREAIRRNNNEQAAAEKQIPILADEIRILEGEKERHEKGNLAALLSADLKPGLPCPVCGSKDHPMPAAAPAPQFGLNERIETQKHLLEESRKKLIICRNQSESLALQLSKAEASYSRCAAELSSIPHQDIEPFIKLFLGDIPGLPPLEKITQELNNQVRELNSIIQYRDAVKNAHQKTPLLYKEKEKKQSQLAALQEELAGISERAKYLEQSVKSQKEKHDRVLAEWNVRSLAEALSALEEKIRKHTNALDDFKKRHEDARNTLAAVSAERELSEKQMAANREKCRRSRETLDEVIGKSSFKTPEDLQDSFLSGDDEKSFREEIEQWKQKVSRNKSIREELQKSAAKLEDQKAETGVNENIDEIQARREDLGKRQKDAEKVYEDAISFLASLEKDAKLLRETSEKHRAIAEEARKIKILADDLGGRNPKRTGFDSWLLGLYLKEVAAYASRRLERMSESRYSLLLDTEGDSARGKAGLDLAVFDAHTGKTRPCATLSGGESFMASISLALGLADSIQNRSGGIRLDAVFIDEGFGSLDDASLDKALTILEELKEHRMVGLISHVGEMRSRIPSRIEIHKTATGSSITVRKSPDYRE